MERKIPYGRQYISQDDIDAVVTTLQADFLTQGPKIAEFEEAFARYVGSQFAVAVSNGTAALHLSALALEFTNGKKVISTPLTFSASTNSVKYCGGEIDFVDIDPSTYLMDLDQLQYKLETSPKGTYSGVIPVQFAGRSVDLKRVKELANQYDLKILEDACHAPGGYYEGMPDQKCGNGNYADLAIFSFHPVKHIASGEGGMITTNSKALYQKLLRLRTHGITRESNLYENSISIATGVDNDPNIEEWPGWYMEMQELGYNYRLTDFQAALGLSQLKRADEGLVRRREIAAKYQSAFEGKNHILGQSGVVEGHAYHLYIIEVPNRLGLYKHLREKGVFAQVHYIPVHIMPFYQNQGWKKGDFPIVEKYYSRCLSLPMFPTLTDEEQSFVIDCIHNFYVNAV